MSWKRAASEASTEAQAPPGPSQGEGRSRHARRQLLWTGLAGLTLAGAFYAGMAFAADPKLEDADLLVEKAVVLLDAAQNPEVNPPFGGHRAKAILLLKQARKEIEKAQKFADKPPKEPKKPKHDHDHDKKKKK